MKNRSTSLNICLITLTFVIAIVIIYVLTNSLFVIKYEKSNYYIMGKDKIPSIYKINGKRNLYYYKGTNNKYSETKTFKYKNVENVKSDIYNYITELRENYNFAYTSNINLNDNEPIELSCNSVNSNKIIILKITFDDSSYIINITKGKGNINFYK